ncbi:MAG: hypothetical protein Unbinned2514contig1001_16 [Prokaryotic dsDNA virus sp.]|nr:MAG: hypothetical protein Unbinned2514contig1001_16 [Prokaryotic dsDNA virus sp.]
MKIIARKPNDLKAAEYNPRQLTQKQFEDLKKSITDFGFVEPIVVNENKKRKDVVVGGHQRLKIAEDLGMETIPCVHVNLTEPKERELNIRLNKNNGQWDFDLLANHFDIEELVDWGFDEKSLMGVFDEIDYSILDDDDDAQDRIDEIDGELRKAIQIEFNTEDYDKANSKIAELRKNHDYIGDIVLGALESIK